MKKKLVVAVLFGGKSAEHEVSLNSAKNVIAALNPKKYSVLPIYIERNGRWLFCPEDGSKQPVAFLPSSKGLLHFLTSPDQASADKPKNIQVDVVFPVLHGTFGEDGSIQGLLQVAEVPFVGAGVLGSAVGMDKVVMKRLLRDAGILVAPFLVARVGTALSFASAAKTLGVPFFVKPASLGSSVGVAKVTTKTEYSQALETAFLYDTKVILEQAIVGREVECSVLGNEKPIASLPGEVVLQDGFYSYETKYASNSSARIEIPANLPKKTTAAIQELAVRTYSVLECEGLGRVDFFLTTAGRLIVNEINTLPGFTATSMYPKMWEASGMSLEKVVDTLIKLAQERFATQQLLKRSK